MSTVKTIKNENLAGVPKDGISVDDFDKGPQLPDPQNDAKTNEDDDGAALVRQEERSWSRRRRYLIENVFAKLEEFKAISLRREKTNRNFAAMINPCAAVINPK